MKKALILLMGLILVLSLGACGKSDAAQAVDEKIAAIGEVTLDSEALISDAELSLAALTQEEKEQVREQVEQYKKQYDTINKGEYYRLTSPVENRELCAWEFVSQDRKKALLFGPIDTLLEEYSSLQF